MKHASSVIIISIVAVFSGSISQGYAALNLISPPRSINVQQVKNSLLLTWKKPFQFVDGYRIYRSSSRKILGTVITTISDPHVISFVDSSIMPNSKYYYTIRSFLSNGPESRNTRQVYKKVKMRRIITTQPPPQHVGQNSSNFKTDTISDKEYKVYQEPGYFFRIVCELPCALRESLIQAQYQGAKISIQKVMELFPLPPLDGHITYRNYYTIESLQPVDIHLTSDSECGTFEIAQQNNASSFASERERTENNHITQEGSYICTFRLEKSNQGLGEPFTEDVAANLKGDPGIVHEYAHIALFGRAPSTHDLVVPITQKILRHVTSDSPPVTSACDEDFNRRYQGQLVYILCKRHGFDFDDFPKLFRNFDTTIHKQLQEDLPLTNYYGRLSTAEFKKAFDEVIGVDTLQDFLDAGYSPDFFN